MDPGVETYKEKSDRNNIRYLAYNLLQKIEFNEEPVVPTIIEEKEDPFLGKYFNTEKLGGIDLDIYIHDRNQPITNKLLVLLNVVGQLKAIDSAGFVIFDRNWTNIRVLSSDLDHISIRQMDIEDIYDKNGDCVYTERGLSATDETIDSLREENKSLWFPVVDDLTLTGELIASAHQDESIKEIFSNFRWTVLHNGGGDLNQIEKVCLNALKLSKVTT